MPPNFDNFIQNQHNSASDAPEGAKDESLSGLYQSTKNYGNTDDKDNDN